jgi:SAM-dependent methyltransferase
MELKLTKKQYEIECLINGNKMAKILDFGMHPFADTFVKQNQVSFSEPVYPLQCFLDQESGLIQLANISNDYDRYNLYDYSYTSSNSNFAKNHWNSYAETVNKKFSLLNKFIVEIGSNDGYLIGILSQTNKVLGVDASKEMTELANSNGVESINAIFNKDTSDLIQNKYNKADLIIANNVFNHSNNPLDFASGVKDLLKDDGVFVFELPYWGDTVKSKKFDQVYHEHITYFTVKSSYHLLKSVGLEIFDIEFVNYHGGSIRVYSKKEKDNNFEQTIQNLITEETDLGLFEIETYTEWQKEIELERSKFLIKLHQIKIDEPDAVIIGVGAAAKANTLLNYYKIDNSLIDFVTDSSLHKQGKYTPLSRIPITDDNIFSEYENVYALILSWNISDTLKEILSKINTKIKYINL